jgi:hypothetical protein
MKKQKFKKKPHKIQHEQREAKPAVIANDDTELLELAPQRPLSIEGQAQFQPADIHKH